MGVFAEGIREKKRGDRREQCRKNRQDKASRQKTTAEYDTADTTYRLFEREGKVSNPAEKSSITLNPDRTKHVSLPPKPLPTADMNLNLRCEGEPATTGVQPAKRGQ